jgi:SulP family sulfate permease
LTTIRGGQCAKKELRVACDAEANRQRKRDKSDRQSRAEIGEEVASTIAAHAFAIGVLTLAIFYTWPFLTRRVPASVMAVIIATAVAYFAGWPVATIDSRFGGIPAGWPGLHFPAVTLESMRDLMGPAFTIAALGAIESLLSAMVADGMTDTRHDPNQELRILPIWPF